MKEIDIKITSVEVVAEARKLRCNYTKEMITDIKSYSGISYDELGIKPINRINSINKIFKTKEHDN